MFKEWSEKSSKLQQFMENKEFLKHIGYIKSKKVWCKAVQQDGFDMARDVDKMVTTWIEITPKHICGSVFDMIVAKCISDPLSYQQVMGSLRK